MRRLLGMVAGIMLPLQLPAQTNTAVVKLAIVSESPQAANVADILTVKFSKNEQVQLLERSEIERVYREQRLSVANADYLKLGQVLGADGLLLLDMSQEGTNQYLNARLVAVKPGVVLTAEKYTNPDRDPAEWSSNYVNHLNRLLPKLTVLAKDAIPISIVNLRSAVSSANTLETERQLKLLTIQRLSQERRIFVLEREKMQLLGEEKGLALDNSAFWNGSYLLDGVIDQNGFSKDTITINAQLTPPKKGAPIRLAVSGYRTNLLELINDLATKVIVALKVNPTTKEWHAADEATQFFKEANWALRWGVFTEAEAAADSAWALGKQDLDCALVRGRAYLMEVQAESIPLKHGQSTLSPGYNADGKPLGPAPSDDAVKAEIGGLYNEYPLMAVFKVTEQNQAKTIDFAFLDKSPEPDSIDHAFHTLQLYYNFSRKLQNTDSNHLGDGPWYQLGLNELKAASKVLQAFYFTPTARNKFANKLAELREQTRMVAKLLFQVPTVHDSYFVGNHIAVYDKLYHFEETPSIFSCMVDWGCFWQETPEDCVALYRQLMASPVFCYVHTAFWNRDITQPRLVAWNDKDRQRIPIVWGNFLNELNTSTNVLWQMESKALEMTDATNQALANVAKQEWWSLVRSNRAELVANNVDLFYLGWHFDSTPETEAMEREYQDKTVPALKTAAAFEEQKEFLKRFVPYDFMKFNQVFAKKSYSLEQAREILPLIDAYQSNLLAKAKLATFFEKSQLQNDAHSVDFFLKRNVEQILQPTPPSKPKPPVAPSTIQTATTPQAKPVPALPIAKVEMATNIIDAGKFLEIPLDALKPQEGEIASATICAHHWQEQKLVLNLVCNITAYSFDKQGNFKGTRNVIRPAIAILNPDTKQWSVIGCPEVDLTEGNQFYHHTTIWHGQVFTSNGGQVRKYDPAKKTWQTLEIPGLGNCELFTVNDHLYAAAPNLIVEILNGGTHTHILASNRRQPPVSALDTENLGIPILFAGPEHSLRVATSDKIFSWNGMDWKNDCSSPSRVRPTFSDDGILFIADGWNAPAGIWRLTTKSDQAESCLVQVNHTDMTRMSIGSVHKIKTTWKLPDGLSWHGLPVASRGPDLAIMGRHVTEQNMANEREQTITAKKIPPQNGRLDVIDYFAEGYSAPLKLYLRFDDRNGATAPIKDDQQTTRFNPPGSPQGWMYFGGKHVFLGREVASPLYGAYTDFQKPGVWMISLKQVDSEIERQKQIQQEKQTSMAAAARLKWQTLLKKYDKNQNGVLDSNEKETALADSNFIKLELDKIDANQNGWLDADELVYFDANRNQTLDPTELTGIGIAQNLLAANLIRQFDYDRDGFLNRNEFDNLMRSGVSTQLHELFFPDINHDGKIDVNEVQTICEQITGQSLAQQHQPPTFFPSSIHTGIISSSDTKAMFKQMVEDLWRGTNSNANQKLHRPMFVPPMMLRPGESR